MFAITLEPRIGTSRPAYSLFSGDEKAYLSSRGRDTGSPTCPNTTGFHESAIHSFSHVPSPYTSDNLDGDPTAYDIARIWDDEQGVRAYDEDMDLDDMANFIEYKDEETIVFLLVRHRLSNK